jgi:hypothetical protein
MCQNQVPFFDSTPPPGGGWDPLAPRRVSAGASDFFWGGYKNLTENSKGGMFLMLCWRVFQRRFCPHFHFRRRDRTLLCHRNAIPRRDPSRPRRSMGFCMRYGEWSAEWILCDSGPAADTGVLVGYCIVFRVDPAIILSCRREPRGRKLPFRRFTSSRATCFSTKPQRLSGAKKELLILIG